MGGGGRGGGGGKEGGAGKQSWAGLRWGGGGGGRDLHLCLFLHLNWFQW